MATRKRKAKAGTHPLDAEPYRTMIKNATEAADRALARYGEPTMSLEELRAALDAQLGDVSLAEEVIKNRKESF